MGMNTKEYWNKIAVNPEAITPGGQWEEKFVTLVVDDLVKNIPVDVLKESRLVDVGCGEGRLMWKLAPRVKEYIGVDISNVVLDRAKALSQKLEYKNVEFIELQSEYFVLPEHLTRISGIDVAVSWTVFMQLPREIFIRYLKGIHFYLRSGGFFNFQLNDQMPFHTQDTNHRFDRVPDDDRWKGRWYPEWLVSDYLTTIGFDLVSIPGAGSECWRSIKK